MHKDFDSWNIMKKSLQYKTKIVYFQEREIWFCHLGSNVGFEQDGKGKEFLRPILIIKKFNESIFIGLPLTTNNKSNKHYYPLKYKYKLPSSVILSQIRIFDSKRLEYKIGTIEKVEFSNIKQKLQRLLKL